MTTHRYSFTESSGVGTTGDQVYRMALDAGYTNVVVAPIFMTPETIGYFDVTFDEADDWPTTLANLESAMDPILSVDDDTLEIVGDGVTTGSVILSDNRGLDANGKTVTLEVHDGALALPGGLSYTLGVVGTSDGSAVITFGPSPAANWCSAPIKLCFLYSNGESQLCEMTVQYVEA